MRSQGTLQSHPFQSSSQSLFESSFGSSTLAELALLDRIESCGAVRLFL